MEDIISQLQALQSSDDTAIAAIITAIQNLPPPQPATTDPNATITVTTQSGATQVFVPQTA